MIVDLIKVHACYTIKICFKNIQIGQRELGAPVLDPPLLSINYGMIKSINNLQIVWHKWPHRWRSGLERSPRKLKVGCLNPTLRRDRPKWVVKQVVPAPLSNGDDHYKRMPRVIVEPSRSLSFIEQSFTPACYYKITVGIMQSFVLFYDAWTSIDPIVQ